ncbi:MAG: phosphate ABC transporter permease [delta proteobacterium ML8_D]|jgi:phosphate transport system permease protein|nr:MAG: phosphate ABC transporter permease [delta proteobacterium ML8_D]
MWEAKEISRKRKRIIERVSYAILLFLTLIVIAFVVGIVVYLVVKGSGAINWEFLSRKPELGMREGGIFPAILGTLYLMIGTFLFSLPVGILAAVYLNEYASKNRLTRIIRLSIINMSGVPSVVYGLFGLGFFVMMLNFGRSILAGSLTLALLILPVIITSTEEALKTVPESYRHASLALGATRWQTIVKVVLPRALPGIITGSVIGIGRAAGETAPIMFTVAAFSQPNLPNSIFSQVMALPYHLYVLATQLTDTPEDMQWGTALVLLILVLIFAVSGTAIRTRFRLIRKE